MSDRRMPPSQKRWYRSQIHECTCGFGEEFLLLHYDDWTERQMTDCVDPYEQPEWYFAIVTVWRSWPDRIRAAWRILRGHELHYHSLDLDMVDLREMRDAIDGYLADWTSAEAQEWLARAEGKP